MRISDEFYHSSIHTYIHNCSVSVFVLHTILNCKWQISLKWFPLAPRLLPFYFVSFLYAIILRLNVIEICEFRKCDASNNDNSSGSSKKLRWLTTYERQSLLSSGGWNRHIYLSMYLSLFFPLCFYTCGLISISRAILNAFHWRIKTLSLCIPWIYSIF